uniref:Uncharacterized protein n=1 Tax=Trichogramma kaykai TaxID=54128 RepID=A0ABD2X527_9HYME
MEAAAATATATVPRRIHTHTHTYKGKKTIPNEDYYKPETTRRCCCCCCCSRDITYTRYVQQLAATPCARKDSERAARVREKSDCPASPRCAPIQILYYLYSAPSSASRYTTYTSNVKFIQSSHGLPISGGELRDAPRSADKHVIVIGHVHRSSLLSEPLYNKYVHIKHKLELVYKL